MELQDSRRILAEDMDPLRIGGHYKGRDHGRFVSSDSTRRVGVRGEEVVIETFSEEEVAVAIESLKWRKHQEESGVPRGCESSAYDASELLRDIFDGSAGMRGNKVGFHTSLGEDVSVEPVFA